MGACFRAMTGTEGQSAKIKINRQYLKERLFAWSQQMDVDLMLLVAAVDEADKAGGFGLRNRLAMPLMRLSRLSDAMRRFDMGVEEQAGAKK